MKMKYVFSDFTEVSTSSILWMLTKMAPYLQEAECFSTGLVGESIL